MKEILIVAHALEIGGAERALLGLLNSFDYSKYRVDLFLMRHEGELLELLPEEVNLLPEIKQYTALATPMIKVIKRGILRVVIGRIQAKIKAHNYVKKYNVVGENGVELEYSHKYTLNAMPQISKKSYDMAISFLTPHYFAATKVKAKKRIAWIHTDYSYVKIDVESEYKMWNAYDYIASISEDCTKGFLSKFPTLERKIVLIENIISSEFIRRRAEMDNVEKEMPDDENIKILSIGRFTYQKNFDNVPEICRNVLDQGLSVKWYLIGFGSEEENIRKKIATFKVEDNVIILGKKANPYPYIEKCDVYIQPSRYEGKCVAVREAQILGKPVVITEYPTAKSQLEDGVDGVIVPLDNEGCAKGISDVLNQRQQMMNLVINCRSREYSNKKEVMKVYSLLETV